MKREILEGMQNRLNSFCGDLDTYFESLETELEKELIDFLGLVQIQSSVKTEKYTLPWQEQVVVELYSESYINGMFERERIFRPILRELLTKNVFKIRFYFHIETFGDMDNVFSANGIKYSFRYYIH